MVIYVRIKYHGKNLANFVTRSLNGAIAGKLEIESLEWPILSIYHGITGGFIPAKARNVKIFDEFGELVVETPLLTGHLDIHAVFFGAPDVVLKDVFAPKGGKVRIVEKKYPYAKEQFSGHSISLLRAFNGKKHPHLGAGTHAHKNPLFNLQRLDGDHIDLEVVFRDFQASLQNIHIEGSLLHSGQDPINHHFIFSLEGKAEKGRYILPPLIDIPLENVELKRLTLLPTDWPSSNKSHDLVFDATATSGIASIKAAGKVIDFYTDPKGGVHDSTIHIENGDRIARNMFDGEMVRGKNLNFDLHLGGPHPAMTMDMEAKQVEVSIPFAGTTPLELSVPNAQVSLDFATRSGVVNDTVVIGSGGEAVVRGTVHTTPSTFDMDAKILKPFDVGRFVSPLTRKALGTKLSGKVHAFGSPEVVNFDETNMTLGNAKITGKGQRTTTDKIIYLNGLQTQTGKTRASNIRGAIDVENDKLDVEFKLDSKDAPKWFAFYDTPPSSAKRVASNKIKLTGSYKTPDIKGNIIAEGVPYVGSLNTKIDYTSGQTVNLENTNFNAFGGEWIANGNIDTDQKDPKFKGFKLTGKKIRLRELPLIGNFVEGTGTLRLKADGAASKPLSDIEADLKDLFILGEHYDDTKVVIKTRPKGVSTIETVVTRKNGGQFEIHGKLRNMTSLGGWLLVKDMPVQTRETKKKLDIGGLLNATINLSGTLDKPNGSGQASLDRSWFGDLFLGNTSAEFNANGPGKMSFDFNLLQGSIHVEGDIETFYPYRTKAEATFRRFEIDRFASQLPEDIRGYVSGKLQFDGPLVAKGKNTADISLFLSEASILVDGYDDQDRPKPLRIRNKTPLHMKKTGDKFVLVEEALFEAPFGSFTMIGNVSEKNIDMNIRGDLDGAKLSPYLKNTLGYFDDVSGTIGFNGAIKGSTTNPKPYGTLDLNNIRIKTPGQDTYVEVPSGKISIDDSSVSLTGLSLLVKDEFTSEDARLTLSGGVQLEDYTTPKSWAVLLDGTLAGRMLLAFAPQLFSDARGTADLSIALFGDGVVPNFDGSLDFSKEKNFAFTPRGSGKELAVTGGSVRFSDDIIELDNMAGVVDDEGLIKNVYGEIDIQNQKLHSVDISGAMVDLPFKIPKELELLLSADSLHLLGGEIDCPYENKLRPECYELSLSGNVKISDGRYIKYFNPLLQTVDPVRVVETSVPLHEEYPILAGAQLDLTVDAEGFAIKNNVAKIDLGGVIQVGGTLKRPTFQGDINIEQGTVKLQGVRAKFEQTSGNISFERTKQFPEQTPYFEIKSQSNYRDLDGEDHLINLLVIGTIDKQQVELGTQKGLNSGQTVSLLFLGRSTDANRELLLGDNAVTSRVGQIQGNATTADSDNALNNINEGVKDLSGDYFDEIIGSQIKDIIDFDEFSFSLGTTSVGIRGRKFLTESLQWGFVLDRTIQGQSYNMNLGYRINDVLSTDAEMLVRFYEDPAQIDDQQFRLKTTQKFRIR